MVPVAPHKQTWKGAAVWIGQKGLWTFDRTAAAANERLTPSPGLCARYRHEPEVLSRGGALHAIADGGWRCFPAAARFMRRVSWRVSCDSRGGGSFQNSLLWL